MDGVILNKDMPTYKRIVKVHPVERSYYTGCKKNGVKYTCPVCDALKCRHQLTKGDDKCPICGVMLSWEPFMGGSEEC